MARTVRIGIIGYGKMAHVDHVPHDLHLNSALVRRF
jgi:hypothetical protein